MGKKLCVDTMFAKSKALPGCGSAGRSVCGHHPAQATQGIMEKKMETTIIYRGYIWGYIGMMEKKMETTIIYLVFLPSPLSLLTDSSPEGSVNWRSATIASQDLLSAQSALVPYHPNKAVASD